MPVALVALGAALALLVSSGVATGASPNATPKKWVATFCRSSLTWERTLKSGIAKLQNAAKMYQGGDLSLPAFKGKVVSFLGNLVTESATVVKQIRGVGAPAVPNGARLQQGELRAFGQAEKVFQNAKNAAKRLSTRSAQEFGKGLTAVGQEITAAGHKITVAESKLHKYSSKALDEAAKHDPACSQVRSFLP